MQRFWGQEILTTIQGPALYGIYAFLIPPGKFPKASNNLFTVSQQTISTPGLDYIHTGLDSRTSAILPYISLDLLTHLGPSLPILPTVKLIACQMVPAKSTLLERQIT